MVETASKPGPNHTNCNDCNGQRSTDGTDVSWDAAWGCFLMSVSGDFPPSHAPRKTKRIWPLALASLISGICVAKMALRFCPGQVAAGIALTLWHFDTSSGQFTKFNIASFFRLRGSTPGWDNAAPWKPPGIPASYLKLKPLRTGKSVGLVWRSHTARKVRWSSEGIASELYRIHDTTISIRIPWDSKLSSFDCEIVMTHLHRISALTTLAECWHPQS